MQTYYCNREIRDRQVTDNSIFPTWKRDDYDSYQYNNLKEAYYIVRTTKNFEYPVEIYKGSNYRDEDNKEAYTGVEQKIDVIGNHIYFNNGSGRVSIIGEQRINLNEILGFEIDTEKMTKKHINILLQILQKNWE